MAPTGCDCSTAEALAEKSSVLYFCASWARLTSQRLTQPSTGNKLPAGQNIKIFCLQAPTSSFQIVAIQIFKEHFLTVLIRTMKFTQHSYHSCSFKIHCQKEQFMPHLLLNFNTEHLRNITLTLHAHLQLTLTLLEEHLHNYKGTCKDTCF